MSIKNKEGAQNEALQVPQVAPERKQRGKQTEASKALFNQGQEIYASMTEEQRAFQSSLSGTLHFQYLLGLDSVKKTRRSGRNENSVCADAVAVALISDIDVSVPQIDILKNTVTGVDVKTDITYKDIPANELFILSYIEFMYFIIRPEYGCFCEANGNDRGAFFSPRIPAFWRHEAKLPTPTINLADGQIKANIVALDEQDASGTWHIKPQYAEKFGPLLRSANRPQRSSGSKSKVATPTIVAVALRSILGLE